MPGGISQVTLATSTTCTALIAHLSGEIDVTTADAAGAELMRAAAGLPPPGLIVLDMTAVSFFSAAGLHLVRAFATACADRGIRIRLVVDPYGTVHRVVTLTGLDTRLPTFTTLSQAL